MERLWCGYKRSYNHTHGIHRTDNPGRGADLRGAMITRIGSTELITPEMRGVGKPWCGSKGSYNHTRIGSTELITPDMRGVDLRGALIMRMGSTELITPDMRGCGEIMVRI